MKDFEKLQRDCINEIKSVGISPADKINWKINYRAKSRWGQCKKLPDGSFEIQIAQILLADERISEKDCKNTIIHELLHTCKDSMKHTGKWAENAKIMNNLYGYEIKRVTSGSEKGVENYQSKQRPVKYVFICKKCGQVVKMKKACKFTKYYKNYTCTICNTQRAFIKIL